MAILQLSMSPANGGRHTLLERGDQYEQFSHFRTVEEVSQQLGKLGLTAWQIQDLWDGKEVELDPEHSWPHCTVQEVNGKWTARKLPIGDIANLKH
jgi:hypothetical protein